MREVTVKELIVVSGGLAMHSSVLANTGGVRRPDSKMIPCTVPPVTTMPAFFGNGGYDGDGSIGNPELGIGITAMDNGAYNIYVGNANGASNYVVSNTGSLESTLPGECSIGSLAGGVATGAISGAVFGAGAGVETGPGMIITGLAGAIAGAGVGAVGSSIACAVALWRRGQ